ncbi:hypothetical protein PTKIN_Ptkin06aG0126800 [Pterospermum kingtungense]
MDFHSLTRKELQTLCKKNKIPANITNVAMADALTALEIVDGLDEILNQSQSPEKTINKSSQDVPSTVTRTSTRRKTTKEEPQSTLPKTQIRRMTRTTMELDEENKNVNVPETLVMATATTTRRRAQKTESEVEQKKSGVLETPALQSGGGRTGAGSTRKKVEAQKEVSVQHSYGTRRSVRLLEKCMSGLSLKEPVKIDEMLEDDQVEDIKNGQSEAPAEVPLARNLSVSLEDERDIKEDVLEKIKCDHSGVNDSTMISEAASDKSDILDTQDASSNDKTKESDSYLAPSSDKLADVSDGTIDPKGSDDLAVPEDSHEIDNSNEELVGENSGGSHADETKSTEVLVADALEEVSEEAPDHSDALEEVSEEALDHSDALEEVSEEALDHSSSVEEYAANQAPQEIDCQKLAGEGCDINEVMLNDDLPKEHDEGKISEIEESEDDSDQTVDGSKICDAFLSDSDIEDGTGFDNNSSADELEEEVLNEEEKSISSISTAALSFEDPMTDIGNDEALVDVNVAEAQLVESSFHIAPQSVVGDIPKMPHYVSAETLVDICVKPAEEFEEIAQEISPEKRSPTSLISNSEIATTIPLTAQSAPPRKEKTNSKVILVSDNKKENIENNSVKEVEPNMGKGKKNKIIDEETMQKLQDLSLRDLRKLTKKFNKLKINDNMKNKDDKSVGKTRRALQALRQNCMSTGEEEKQN